MAETERESRPSDRAVFGLCELLGLVFALPFGEDLYRSTPVTLEHIFYLFIGALFVVAGPMWPRLRTFMPARVSATVTLAATDFRLWLGVLLTLYIAGTTRLLSEVWSMAAIGVGVVAAIALGIWNTRAKGRPNVFLVQMNEIRQALKENIEQMSRLETKFNVDRRQSNMQFEILLDRLRARDAEVRVKEADRTILNLGRRLLEASHYQDEDAWITEYTTWENAITMIDRITQDWDNTHTPFFNDRLTNIDNAPGPPAIIVKHANVTRYKLVWNAQQSYANRRSNLLLFFETKGRLP